MQKCSADWNYTITDDTEKEDSKPILTQTYKHAFHRSRKKGVPRFKVTTEGVLAQPVDDASDQSLNLLWCFWVCFISTGKNYGKRNKYNYYFLGINFKYLPKCLSETNESIDRQVGN